MLCNIVDDDKTQSYHSNHLECVDWTQNQDQKRKIVLISSTSFLNTCKQVVFYCIFFAEIAVMVYTYIHKLFHFVN